MTKKEVAVLVFNDCPNTRAAIEHARTAIAGTGVAAELRIVHVEDPAEAIRLLFLGSPTVRVDGTDVEPAAHKRIDYGLQCRVYSVNGQLQGAPPAEWITSALLGEAKAHDKGSR